jgi:hypothetical protein
MAETQALLEAVIKGEVLRMYQEVAAKPEGEFHFYHGREPAEMFGYDRECSRCSKTRVSSAYGRPWYPGSGSARVRHRMPLRRTV